MQYVVEAIRAEGTSEWRAAAHYEFALVMDGTAKVDLMALDEPAVPADRHGSVRLEPEPAGRPMGRLVRRQGHMALLPLVVSA
jgi:hypothetical protein